MKSKLFTPGPTKVPGAVLAAVGKQVLHHRSPEFSEKVRHVQDELGRLLQTHNDTLLFTCSGTGMMEAAVANLLSRGDKAICVNNGVFGERWVDICKVYGVEADRCGGGVGEEHRAREAQELWRDASGREGRLRRFTARPRPAR